MALLVPNVGEREMLKYIVGQPNPASLSMGLYDNTQATLDTLTEDAVLATFELAEDGLEVDSTYAAEGRVTLPPGNWIISTDGGGVSTAIWDEGTYGTVDFSFSGSDGAKTIWGYFIVNDSGDLLWAERFAIDVNLGSSGGIISVIPQISLN